MFCLIKNIPDSAKVLYGTGNKGLFFPLVPICATIAQPEAPPPEECYLAVELGNLTTNVCHPCYGTHGKLWDWDSNRCNGGSSEPLKWEDTNCNKLFAKQWIDCFGEYNLDWSWASRKCSANPQTKWKDVKCTAPYAKKWKRENTQCTSEACLEKHNLQWQWKARECANSLTITKWKDAECSGTYAKKWKYEAPEFEDQLTDDEILLELLNPVTNSDYRIQAPCVEEEFCYIALQEDGITSIDTQETDNVFLTDCIG
jgi:hypothetical protein